MSCNTSYVRPTCSDGDTDHVPKSTSLAPASSPSGPATVVRVCPHRGPGGAPANGNGLGLGAEGGPENSDSIDARVARTAESRQALTAASQTSAAAGPPVTGIAETTCNAPLNDSAQAQLANERTSNVYYATRISPHGCCLAPNLSSQAMCQTLSSPERSSAARVHSAGCIHAPASQSKLAKLLTTEPA